MDAADSLDERNRFRHAFWHTTIQTVGNDSRDTGRAVHANHCTVFIGSVLSRAVRQALARAPGFNVAGVFVRARDGAVFLSGTVHSADQIRQAEQIARTVPGVLVVSNKLTLWHGGNG
ncbi:MULTISPECIES: BON domain-containing protein [Paraburkholderia]|uniref:BON domain-containing protein n=1 Tax=Paraburkholderia dilworthii TaxID=948106 RepID=A0ABW9D1P0_9BURK|nr:BON domain-containing protein [Paraburkholderia bryophila]